MVENSTNTAPGRPFPPGVSGNPNGRPKGSRNRSTIVNEILEAIDPDTKLSYVEAMTYAVARKATAGDVPAFKELMDSGFGKIADRSELSGPNGGPIETKNLTEVDKDILAAYIAQNKPVKTTEGK